MAEFLFLDELFIQMNKPQTYHNEKSKDYNDMRYVPRDAQATNQFNMSVSR